MKVSVIIPSRLAAQDPTAPESPLYVERAIDVVRKQTLWALGHTFECVIGVDPGAGEKARERLKDSAVVAEANKRNQSAALNAALRKASGDVIACLEDDDQWSPEFLHIATSMLTRFDFVSSTQLLIDPFGKVIKILDFPTPSGWVMPRSTYERVGGFNEDYRWHIDNDYLGRVVELGLRRAHLVEATGPIDPVAVGESRPCLMQVLNYCGEGVELVRHNSPWPLVARMEHPGSGMDQIETNDALWEESRREYKRLEERFGSVPW